MLRQVSKARGLRQLPGYLRCISDQTPSSNMYPPANAARGATADLCDVYYTDPVDKVVVPGIQIADPIFR